MGEQGAGGRGLGGRDRTPETACRCHGCSGREGRFRRRECAHYRSFELWGHSCSSLFFDHDDEPSWSFPSCKKSSFFLFGGCDPLPSEDAPHRQPVGRRRARRDEHARTEVGGHNGECRHRPAGAVEHPWGYRGAREVPRAPRWGRRRHTRRRHRRRRPTAPGRRRGAGRPRVGGIHDGGGGDTAAAPAVIAPRLRDKRGTRWGGGAGTHWAIRRGNQGGGPTGAPLGRRHVGEQKRRKGTVHVRQ